MTSRHWMPFYVGDYLADTAHLSTTEHGAYFLLIMAYWRAGGLPPDDEKLARIARMTIEDWMVIRSTIAAFFDDGWRHTRIDAEIAKSDIAHLRRSQAGKRGGIAAANGKQCLSNAASPAQASSQLQLQPEKKKDTDPRGSAGVPAHRDVRTDLFGRGLATLAAITGKTPDSCRSLVGKWLKFVNDEAIHVLAAIEDAERNRVADPVAWIMQALKSHGAKNGKRSVQDAARALVAKFGNLPTADGRGTSRDPVRVLPQGRSE